MVPGTYGSGESPSSGGQPKGPPRSVFPLPPMFQIPFSQDPLAQGATQDISTGFSQPGRHAVCTCTVYLYWVHVHVSVHL